MRIAVAFALVADRRLLDDLSNLFKLRPCSCPESVETGPHVRIVLMPMRIRMTMVMLMRMSVTLLLPEHFARQIFFTMRIDVDLGRGVLRDALLAKFQAAAPDASKL